MMWVYEGKIESRTIASNLVSPLLSNGTSGGTCRIDWFMEILIVHHLVEWGHLFDLPFTQIGGGVANRFDPAFR